MTKSEILKYLRGETTADERAKMLKWLEADPLHMEEMRCLRRIFDATLCGKAPLAIDGDDSQPRRMQPLVRRLMRVAAAVAVVCLLGGMAWLYTGRMAKQEPLLANSSIHVPVGQRAEITLSDGTRVWLNSNTTLRMATSHGNNSRDIELNGEAYFEVTHDEHRPFVVHTGGHEVQVLGTKFNVYAYNDSREFSVRLYDGSVNVSDTRTKEHVLLVPNEKARMLADGRLVKTGFERSESLLWLDGIYYFDNLDYGSIFKKLQEYYRVRIDVRSPEVSRYRCTCKFRQEDGLRHIINILQSIHPFQYDWNEDTQTVTVR